MRVTALDMIANAFSRLWTLFFVLSPPPPPQANYHKEWVRFLRRDLSGTIHRSNTDISLKPSLLMSMESTATTVVAIISREQVQCLSPQFSPLIGFFSHFLAKKRDLYCWVLDAFLKYLLLDGVLSSFSSSVSLCLIILVQSSPIPLRPKIVL